VCVSAAPYVLSCTLAIAILSLVGTFCWAWRERSRRKSIKEIERARRDNLIAILREYQSLLNAVEAEALILQPHLLW